MPKPTLLLPIEERNRELNSRVQIALRATMAGFDVVIGQQWEIFEKIGSIAPSIILFKGDNTAQANRMRSAKQAGHAVCSIEEEVFGICHEREILRCYDDQIPALVDIVFAQGEFQKAALLKRWPELVGRVMVVGNPRADILTSLGHGSPSPAATELRRRFGPFVLFNTNFASINPAIDDIYGYFELCVRVGMMHVDNPEDMRLLNEQFLWERENFDAVLSLGLRLTGKGINVVLRPHPSENAEIWRKQISSVAGMHIADTGDQLDWLKASELMVHSGCTTGMEAFLMNHPVVALTPGNSPWHEVLTANLVNTTFNDVESAEAAIVAHLDGAIRLDDDRGDRLDCLGQHLDHANERTAAARIVEILTTMASEYPHRATGDLSVLRSRSSAALSDRRLGKVGFDRTDIDRAAKEFQPEGASSPSLEIDELGPCVFLLKARHDSH